MSIAENPSKGKMGGKVKRGGNLELRDVGKEISFDAPEGKLTVKLVMGIKAPKGRCFLFQGADYFEYYRRHLPTQCEAIRAFMEQHKYD